VPQAGCWTSQYVRARSTPCYSGTHVIRPRRRLSNCYFESEHFAVVRRALAAPALGIRSPSKASISVPVRSSTLWGNKRPASIDVLGTATAGNGAGSCPRTTRAVCDTCMLKGRGGKKGLCQSLTVPGKRNARCRQWNTTAAICRPSRGGVGLGGEGEQSCHT
jgi:hypothetical protein